MVIWIFGENYKSLQSLMLEYNNNYFWVFDPPKVPNIYLIFYQKSHLKLKIDLFFQNNKCLKTQIVIKK